MKFITVKRMSVNLATRWRWPCSAAILNFVGSPNGVRSLQVVQRQAPRANRETELQGYIFRHPLVFNPVALLRREITLENPRWKLFSCNSVVGGRRSEMLVRGKIIKRRLENWVKVWSLLRSQILCCWVFMLAKRISSIFLFLVVPYYFFTYHRWIKNIWKLNKITVSQMLLQIYVQIHRSAILKFVDLILDSSSATKKTPIYQVRSK